MKRKRSYKLTLIEVLIAIALLGIILTTLFNCYYKNLKNNSRIKEIKQSVQQIEMFHQRMRNLLGPESKKVYLHSHPDALGLGLHIDFEQPIDQNLDFLGTMHGMLFCNAQKQLCFVTWGNNKQSRLELLLDGLQTVSYELFDAKAGVWLKEWPDKKEEKPSMVKITLGYKDKTQMPFVYFLDSFSEPIELAK